MCIPKLTKQCSRPCGISSNLFEINRIVRSYGFGGTIYYRETFEGENFHQFRDFVAIRTSFLCKIWGRGTFGAAKASKLRKFSP